MGIGEWREIAEWDWVQVDHDSGNDMRVIHCVKETTNDTDEDWFGDGTTMCGIKGFMFIPGMFTRMSPDTHRCNVCCELTGMPIGAQSPKNVEECRPVVEERLKALGS